MKIALCTTVLGVPHALKTFRACAGDAVKFFVALDHNSDFQGISKWGSDDRFCWLTPDYQKKYKCSEALGWRCLARRNTAFLEALSWNADIIYSHDDDNLLVSPLHFWEIERGFDVFNGIKVTGEDGWFDPGSLLIPATRHRGIPHTNKPSKNASHVVDAKIGVAAGLIIGDPDIDASTRIELKPDIGSVHILGSTGVVVDPHTWTVFNSQNTAVIRELVPSWFMMPGVGRHDDIYASLIVQRVARERDLHVHFGPPFTYQQRNEHNLITDMRKEIDGMENTERLADFLDTILLPAKSVIDDTRIIYEALRLSSLVPEQACVAALAWLEDCERVM